MPDIVAPKTQTTLPLVAHFRRFSPRWSATWALHVLKLRPRRHQSGRITPSKAPTRRRHAAKGLRMAQTTNTNTNTNTNTKCATSLQDLGAAPVGAKTFAQHHPSTGTSATKLTQQATKPQFQAILSAQGELFRACRRRPSSALPISTPGPLVWRAPEGPKCLAAVPVGRRQDLAGLRDDTPSRRSASQAPPVGRAQEGPAGLAAGPGRGAWPTGRARRRPEHPWATQQHSTGGRGPAGPRP